MFTELRCITPFLSLPPSPPPPDINAGEYSNQNIRPAVCNHFVPGAVPTNRTFVFHESIYVIFQTFPPKNCDVNQYNLSILCSAVT